MGYTFRDYLTLPSKNFLKTQLLHTLYTTATVGGVIMCKEVLNNIPYYYKLATNKVIETAPNWITEFFGIVTVGSFFTHTHSNFGTKTKLGHSTISISYTAMTYGAYKIGTSTSDYLLNTTNINEVSKKYLGEYSSYTAYVIKQIVGITTATIFPANFIAAKLIPPVTKLEEFALTLSTKATNFIYEKEKIDRETNTEDFQSLSDITSQEVTSLFDSNSNSMKFVD